VVCITDQLSAKTLPASESFETLEGPTYGTVYRGVAYVCSQQDSNGVCTRKHDDNKGGRGRERDKRH